MTRHHVRRPWWHYLLVAPLLRPAAEEPTPVVSEYAQSSQYASRVVAQNAVWLAPTTVLPTVNQGPFLEPGQTAHRNIPAAGRY